MKNFKEKKQAMQVKKMLDIIMIGPDKTGKTCFGKRFAENDFCKNYITWEGVFTKNIIINHTIYKVTLWKHIYCKEFESTLTLLKSCAGLFLFFNNEESFIELIEIFDTVKNYISNTNSCLLI